MPFQQSYTGETKLVMAFDIGTTFSGVSYCILEEGQVPEINGVTKRVLHVLGLTCFDPQSQISWAGGCQR